MFCPECGNQVERSYKFCPECGCKLLDLTQNRTQNVATPAPQPSVATEEKNQKEDQDPKGVKEEQENAAQIKGQPASDDSERARDDTTPEDQPNNTASPATVETRTTTLSPHHGDLVATPQDRGTCREEERLYSTASESISQPGSEAALGLPLSVSTTPPSSTPASDKLTRQQTEDPSDINTEASPDVVQIPTDKSSDIHSGLLPNATSSLTSTKENGSNASELSEQTPQGSDLVAKRSASCQDKDTTINHKTQNLSGRQDDKEDHNNTEQHTFAQHPGRNEDQIADDKSLGYSDEQNPKESKEYSADRCLVAKETPTSTETIDNQSGDKTSTHLERQEQQSVNRDIDVSRSPAPEEEMGPLVEADVLEGSTELPQKQVYI
ncbi:otolith matrix protein OMM-64-like [Trachinotus anak]|uniref:otolith matrix protein OMM-64-like n=1 Tax=Trachinotus anak TaxID=443729 RepID=UPI0039F1D925